MILTAQAEDAGKRLDRFLQERLPAYSRARLQEWIRGSRVRINGKPQKPSFPLHGGESVEVEPADPPPLRAEPEQIPLDILYEDEDVVAVNKPAGMVVHAGAGCRSGTLVNALVARFGTLSGVGGQLRPGIVHRLDRYTSGVILVARHDTAHRDLARQFAERKVEKVYLALVHGVVERDQGKIDRPISRDPVRRIRMTARLGRGRTASTEYRVLRRLRDFTLLEVRIGTGRTHQIRAHMAALGHPVAGDRLYGAPARVGGQETPRRFFLHAHRIRFSQPSTQAPVTVESPLPAELERWLAGLL
ncbi:MAG: RluA family pseudouridine synthase [Bryobacteraceae bacterium]